MSEPNEVTRRSFLAAAASSCIVSSHWPALAGRGEQVKKDVPWLAEVQQPPKSLPDDAPQLSSIISNGVSLSDWKLKRETMKQWWLRFLDPFPVAPAPPPSLEIVKEDKLDGVVRQQVRYAIEPGIESEAYLLRPAAAAGRLPAITVFHSTVNHSIRQPAGVEGRPEKAFGLKMARRGYVAFCPRNFLWPTNFKILAREETERFTKRHPGSKGMAKMLYDARVAVDIVQSLPYVDPNRIGAVGHSLGAKEVLYLAAFDSRVKATVSSEGGIGTRFSNWNAPWYLGPEIDQPSFKREHHELLALVAPRPFLLIGGDSADGTRSWPFIEAALPVYRLYGKPARLGLLNHGKGHSVPPEAEAKIYQWLTTYL